MIQSRVWHFHSLDQQLSALPLHSVDERVHVGDGSVALKGAAHMTVAVLRASVTSKIVRVHRVHLRTSGGVRLDEESI